MKDRPTMFIAFDWLSERTWLLTAVELGAIVGFFALCAFAPIEAMRFLAGAYILGALAVGMNALRSVLRSAKEARR